MCGISGIVQLQQHSSDLAEVLQNMNDRLQHRGPDDEGFTLFSNGVATCLGGKDTPKESYVSTLSYAPKSAISDVRNVNFQLGFGHRRLAIIDLSAGGHQPMCLANDSKLWITLNGEIYNYLELRAELIQLGHRFQTESDTEVVLASYKQWGKDCLSRFNGMWSFVIFDQQKNILFGSRDRFGVKPMYYVHNDQHFAFASEQKSLLEVPSYRASVNTNAILPFLLYGHVELDCEGFFKDLFELSPSHFFEFDLASKHLNIERYYELGIQKKNPTFNQTQFDQAKKNIQLGIEKAIELRFRSDVPIGFCLSGGLDSSTIVCTASELAKKQEIASLKHGIHTFTASNDSPMDESEWAKQVVDQTHATWHNTIVDSRTLVQDIQSLIYYQDIPLATTSTYAQSRVMKAAKEAEITILIDGQGGDELFAGYQSFYYSYFHQLIKSFSWLSLWKEGRSLANSPSSLKALLMAKMKSHLTFFPSGIQRLFSLRLKPETSYLNPDFLKNQQSQLNLVGDFKSDSLNDRLKAYCTEHYLKGLLRWEDRCSMQYSIESRTPFSDDIDLIELAFQMPANYKIRHGWSKYILRESIKGLVPESIRLRKDKKGFSIPQNQWLMEQESAFFTLFQELKALDTHEFVLKSKIEEDWKFIFADVRHAKRQDLIFRYVCYLIWLKQFISPSEEVSLA
jgi:asparagine synthase (glutamine-hydrolysing)